MSFDRLKVGRHTTIEEDDEAHLRELEEAFRKRGLHVSIERGATANAAVDVSWGAKEGQVSEITLNLTEDQVSEIMRQITAPVKFNGFKVTGDGPGEAVEAPTTISLTGDQLNLFLQQMQLRDFDDTIMDDSPRTLNTPHEEVPLDVISYRLSDYVKHAFIWSLKEGTPPHDYIRTSACLNVMESNMGNVKVVSLDEAGAYLEDPGELYGLLSTLINSEESLECANKAFHAEDKTFVKVGIARDSVHWVATVVVQTVHGHDVTCVCVSGSRISLGTSDDPNDDAIATRTQVVIDDYLVPELIRRGDIAEESWLHTFLQTKLSDIILHPHLVEDIS